MMMVMMMIADADDAHDDDDDVDDGECLHFNDYRIFPIRISKFV